MTQRLPEDKVLRHDEIYNGKIVALHVDVIEHPSGTLGTEFEFEGSADAPIIRRAAFVRTARRLMAGQVYVPGRVWAGREVERSARLAAE